MRTFDISCIKISKKWLICYIVILVAAIITGIVLCKTTQSSTYMQNYASEYVYYVFNFRNISLLFPKFFYETVYLYAFFLIAYCTRFRFLTLPFLFFKCMLSSVYCVLIISVSALGGVLAAVFVFIPSAVISFCLEVVLIECCSMLNRRYAFFSPLLFAAVAALAECLLLNVLFRVVIAVV